jgi:hypothetical protein
MTGADNMTFAFDSSNSKSMEIPQSLFETVDADHARDNSTRRSCHALHAFLNTVCVHYKNQQQRVISLHSTQSETIGATHATKEAIHLQNVCDWLPIDKPLYKPTPIYVDSQPTIDTIEANTITT